MPRTSVEDLAPIADDLDQIVRPQVSRIRELAKHWSAKDALAKLSEERGLSDGIREALRALAGVPIAALAEVLEGKESNVDAGSVQKLIAAGNDQLKIALADISAKATEPIVVLLPDDLDAALAEMEKSLAADLNWATAHLVLDTDVARLREAGTPDDIVAAIQRDAPAPKLVADLTDQLDQVTRLRRTAKQAGSTAGSLADLETMASSARDALGPFADPAVAVEIVPVTPPLG